MATKKATPRRAAPAARKNPSRKAAPARKAPTRKTTARKASKGEPPAPPTTLHTLTPYLTVHDANAAMDWYKKAFGAKETYRMPGPDGRLLHASLKIGDSELYMSDTFPQGDTTDPRQATPTVTLHLWTRHVDKLWKGAVDNGATVTMPLDDQFWGDRYGKLRDPYGHSWSLAWKSKLTRKELDAKREEAMKEFAAMAPTAPTP